jgi:tetratricopeptide (TPR) repeat protein
MTQRPARRVVLVGWDAADWKVINPLLDAGQMPGLQSIVENGVRGDLASLAPMISPLLWTSIATGHPATRHGVLSFLEPDPATGGVRTISAASRQVKALWNIFTQNGLDSIVLNWFASQPAEPIRGVVASDLYAKVRSPFGSLWPLAAGAVHPPRLRDKLAELRVHPGELSGDDLLPFIPQLARIDQKKDPRPAKLAVELGEAITLHSAATWLMENERWDFLAVYFTLIDHASHLFMPYYPPRIPNVPEEDGELYREALTGVYRYQDMMLQRMMQLAGPDATFVVISDHGFHSDEKRPALGPEGTLDWKEEWPAQWHRSHGVFCAAGPGIRRDELVFGAGLLDIAPFLLTLFGLPAGEDMPGRILPDAFENPPHDRRIPSWETVPGECGALPKEAAEPWESAEALAQLAGLGYIEKVSDDRARYVAEMGAYENYTLARVHLDAGNLTEAIPLLERAIAVRPVPGMRLALAQCYFQGRRMAEARALVEAVLAEEGTRPHALLIQANLELAEGRPGEALVLLAQAEQMPYPNGMLQFRIGRVYLAMRRWEDAETAFARALEYDPQFALAHARRARALLEMGKDEEAASAALDAIALRYDDAESHFILGVSLARLRRWERAVQALEASLRFRPSGAAHAWLAALHEGAGAAARAQRHRERAQAMRQPA